MAASLPGPGDIVHLNVGGTRFSTSRQTLTWIPDSFFTSMLSGRISTLRDETGAIFIDRDPKLFATVLNYLRTREIDLRGIDVSTLRHEAEFYGISPLVKRLVLCEDLNHSSCGDVLFHCYLPPPVSVPVSKTAPPGNGNAGNETDIPAEACARNSLDSGSETSSNSGATARPGNIIRLMEPPLNLAPLHHPGAPHNHSRNSSLDLHRGYPPPHHSHARSSSDLLSQSAASRNGVAAAANHGHSRASSLDLRHITHARSSSADLNKILRTDLGVLMSLQASCWTDPLRVRIVQGHHNWIVVAYAHFITCYRMKDSSGWQLVFTSPYIDPIIERVALNAKVMLPNQAAESGNKMVAISHGHNVRLWGIAEDGTRTDVGVFNLHVSVDHLFFIGSQLVALSHVGKVGVWHSMTQHWQIQDVVPVASFDTAGSFLLLGCNNGSIYYIDMQKFPLRMKDNDLLITELYRDPSNDVITAISVYLTPKTSMCGNWIEIAYGTSSGAVRVIVQHPETVGHGPQLFQTFTVHRSPVTKVMLSEKYLVSICSEYNHVRTWSVTRFRGMISTQPGSTPLASFKIVSLEDMEPNISYSAGNDCGPYGEQDEEQVFVQKVVPEIDQIYVRLSSTGKRICVIKSVDGTPITAFCVDECEGSNRMGSRSRRYVFTGHTSGAVQMWDLTTALDIAAKGDQVNSGISGGPSPEELLRLLDQCDLSSNSYGSTPCVSPSPSMVAAQRSVARVKAANLAFLSQSTRNGNGGVALSTANGPQQCTSDEPPDDAASGGATVPPTVKTTRC